MKRIEPNKLAEIKSREGWREDGRRRNRKPFGPEWSIDYWVKWATIELAFQRLGLRERASVLDVGMGSGWTSAFLAECGYSVTGIDIAPANVEMALERAGRMGLNVEAVQADMEDFDLEAHFEAALIFDALHHSARQASVIRSVARHLKPGGWLLVGEPSVLHFLSPHARMTTRQHGWIERGISVRRLKRDCRTAGLGTFRRFYQGSRPISRLRESTIQIAKLGAARVAMAPQHSIWLAARNDTDPP